MVLGKLHGSKVIISWVRAPLEARFFSLKSDLNWPYFTISNILESQGNLKTQKFVQEMREIAIAIYLCTHTYTCTLKTQNLPPNLSSIRGIGVSTMAFRSIGRGFEP